MIKTLDIGPFVVTIGINVFIGLDGSIFFFVFVFVFVLGFVWGLASVVDVEAVGDGKEDGDDPGGVGSGVLAALLAPADEERDEEVGDGAGEDDGTRDGGVVLAREEGVAVGEGEGVGGVAAHVLRHDAQLVHPLVSGVHREHAEHLEDHDPDLAGREAAALQHPGEQEHVHRRQRLDHGLVRHGLRVLARELLVDGRLDLDHADGVERLDEGEQQQFRRAQDREHLRPHELLGRLVLHLVGVHVPGLVDVRERDLHVVVVEEVVEAAPDRGEAAERVAEEGAREAEVDCGEHRLLHEAGHAERHVEVGGHHLRVFEEVRGLHRGDLHRAARRAQDEEGRVEHDWVVRRAEHRLGGDFRDHHDRDGPARANDVDELRLEHAEGQARRPERLQVREHHFSFQLVLLLPQFFVFQDDLQRWLS